MPVTREKFFNLYSRLCASKQIEVKAFVMDTYYNLLKNLDLLEDTMNEVMNKTYFRGMPTTSEIIDINKEITKKQKGKEKLMSYKKFYEIEDSKSICTNYNKPEKAKFFFITDLMKINGIGADLAYKIVDNGNIEVPDDYLIKRKDPEYQIEHLGGFK